MARKKITIVLTPTQAGLLKMLLMRKDFARESDSHHYRAIMSKLEQVER